jgi:hypothetical protein
LTKKFTPKTIAGVTGPAGEWNQPKIATGQYLITVKSKGFRTFSIAIEVHNGTLLGLKIKLPVAEPNVTVEVKPNLWLLWGRPWELSWGAQFLCGRSILAGSARR